MTQLEVLNSKLLRKNFVRYVSISMIALTLLITIALTLVHQQVKQEEERLYFENVNKSTKHVIEHYLNEYTHKLRRLLETRSLAVVVEKQDRDGLYALLKPKYELFKEESANFQVMHIHLADGSSFLRMHQPMFYGDDIAAIRPMLQKIHKEHTIMSGYETGVYANVYRIMGPIFNENGEYIGALEIGLNPNFIVEKVEEIYGYSGVYFVKEYMPHLYNDANDYVLDGYRLHAQGKTTVLQIKEMMQGQKHLKEQLKINYEGKVYQTHIIALSDFSGQEIIKLLFFQELKESNLFFTPLQIGTYITIVVLLVLFTRLIYIRIKKYQTAVTKVYKEKIEIIQKHEKNLESLQENNRRLLERFEMAVSGTEDGLWDWNVGSSEVYFSPRWKEMLGYRDNELANSLETWESRVHPDDLATTLEAIQQSQQNNTSYSCIHRLKHKDGHWVWILDRGKSYYDSDGNIIRMVGFHTDISELKELEAELKDSKNLFEMFMSHLPYLVAIRDEAGAFIYENRPFGDFRRELAAQSRDQIEKLEHDAKESGIAENILEYKDGQKVHIFRTVFFRIIQESGEFLIAEIFINMTKQKLLAKELEMKNELMIAQSRHAEMGEMISIIAHQWRQPLGIITMNVNNVLVDMELETLEESALKESLEAITMQASHLSQTIDDFRNFFKPDKLRQSVSIVDVFEQAYNVISQSLENHDIKLIREFSEVPQVKVFSRELQQVFINILKNAKEAMQESQNSPKEIHASIYNDSRNVVVSICDNGGGVEESIAQRIFEPYFSTKEEKNGTGLGLYMSKMIVEKHHCGTLQLQSSSNGSCFLVSIPIHRP